MAHNYSNWSNNDHSMKGNKAILLLVAFLLPLLFIHINDAHDWGDDFAAFIAQAKAILDGKKYFDIGFVPNIEKPDLIASPIGWSILLLPVVKVFGANMIALKMYVSLFFILWAVALFLIFRQSNEILFTMFLILLLFYHPQFVCFKAEILSDAAFAAGFSLSLFLVSQMHTFKKWQLVLLGLLTGLTCLIRPLGFVLVGSMFFQFIRLREWRKISFLLPIVAALLFYFFIDKILFSCENAYGHYTHFLGKELVVNSSENIRFYFAQWQEYWMMLTNNSTGKTILMYLFSVLLIVGLLRYIMQWSVYSVTVLAYLAIVFVWPFRSQGFRYIYPVLPFLVFISFESLSRMIQINRKATTWISSVVIVYLLVKCSAFDYRSFQQAMAVNGSQTPAAKELYSFLASHIPGNSNVVFPKPRVLCLYSNIHALYPIANADLEQVKASYTRYQVQYFVCAKNKGLECYNANYSNYLDSMESQRVLLWSNNDFEVYKRNP